MRTLTASVAFLTIAMFAAAPDFARNSAANQSTQTNAKGRKIKKPRSAGGDVASGSGNIAAGAGKGAGHAAEGVGKGARDLVTLHPVNAAADVGKGGASAGKDVAVGTGKGTGKVFKGIGKGIKHIF